MSQSEKDLNRCKILRENDREITRQLRRHQAIDEEEWRKLRELRSQRSDLFSRLLKLQAIQIAGQGTSMVIPKIPGAAVGAVTAVVTIEIPIIETQLMEIEIRITTIEQAISANQKIIDRYRRNQRSGTAEMRTLHCIF